VTVPVETASYATVTTNGCGLLDAREDGKLLLRGSGAAGLLDAQLSNDVAGLAPDEGCAATLLTAKGRMLAPLRVINRQDGYLLLTERATLQELFDRLRSGGLGWDAQIIKQTLELARIELIGPRTDAVLKDAGFAPPPAALHSCSSDAIRTYDGAELLVPAETEQAARQALLSAGALPATEDLAEILRVEQQHPRWGHELNETAMPEETGLVDELVSFTKGCYVGQETVARLHWKGKPNRHLRKLLPDGPVAAGDPVVLEQAPERELGTVGSVAHSPSEGWLALAMLRREAAVGDTVLIGDRIRATVA